MTITCTIVGDTEHKGKSCLNPDDANKEPFITLPHGSDEEFNVEYTYTICNEGTKNFELIIDNADKSDIVLKGDSLHSWLKDIFQGGKPMAPGECRTKLAKRKLRASAPENPTSFKMTGKTDGKWCGCFLFKKSTIGFSSCDVSDFRITQIALPKDEKHAKFIQLFHPGCGGGVIEEPLALGVVPEKKSMINQHVHLQGRTVRDDGYLVICNEAGEAEQIWPGHCDVNMDDDKFIGDKGKETFVLFSTVINDNDETVTTVYDQYGVFTSDRKPQEIKKGKGVAWRTEFGDGGPWDPSEWVIIKNAEAKCKPGDVCFIHPRKPGPLDPVLRY